MHTSNSTSTFGRIAGRLLRDETGATASEYVVATLAIAVAALAASRALAAILVVYLHRIYLIVTLPIL